MVGNFISYRIKKDAPLWMRTRAKGNHCLTASRSARVCARAHTFSYGKSNCGAKQKKNKAKAVSGGGKMPYGMKQKGGKNG